MRTDQPSAGELNLLMSYEQRIFYYLLRLTGHRETVEDLTQDRRGRVQAEIFNGYDQHLVGSNLKLGRYAMQVTAANGPASAYEGKGAQAKSLTLRSSE